MAAVGALLLVAGFDLAISRRLRRSSPDRLLVIVVTGIACVLFSVAFGLLVGLLVALRARLRPGTEPGLTGPGRVRTSGSILGNAGSLERACAVTLLPAILQPAVARARDAQRSPPKPGLARTTSPQRRTSLVTCHPSVRTKASSTLVPGRIRRCELTCTRPCGSCRPRAAVRACRPCQHPGAYVENFFAGMVASFDQRTRLLLTSALMESGLSDCDAPASGRNRMTGSVLTIPGKKPCPKFHQLWQRLTEASREPVSKCLAG